MAMMGFYESRCATCKHSRKGNYKKCKDCKFVGIIGKDNLPTNYKFDKKCFGSESKYYGK